MELKPVHDTTDSQADCEETERLWDAHATGRYMADGANRPQPDGRTDLPRKPEIICPYYHHIDRQLARKLQP